ncbi:alpha/beta hydrolase [Pseudomonas sp. MF6776]|uniref:alpha/beta hydrolase n=1 Tax=Pseudomonas sp. MF6776 TaxID=2797534 RepID=UPI00190E2B56|nr:alpha/beta hydrolase [Pseudomonas sp. MF6776]MBK3468875.1 alpha/beta hydrolase [Pseudomonas sp. MF6776]
MRTIEDLKLAIAILAQNIATKKPHERLVSSTYLFTAWQTAPAGEFVTTLIDRIERPSLMSRFDALRNTCSQTVLLAESDTVRETLDTHSLSDGAIRLLIKQSKFRGLITRSTLSPPDRARTIKRNGRLEDTRWWLQEPGEAHPRQKVVTRRPTMDSRDLLGSNPPPTPHKRHPALVDEEVISYRFAQPSSNRFELASQKPENKAPIPEVENFKKHVLHFGTDRLIEIDNEGEVAFGDLRGEDKVTYGMASVSVPDVHAEGQIERPRSKWLFFRTPEQDPNKHIVIHKLTPLDVSDWIRNAQMSEGEGLLFIHGFNVSFEEALWRTAQIGHDLKFPGVKLCYSWASCGKVQKYPEDEETVDWSKDHLRTFLTEVTTKLGLSRLHIIAHSMGNRALLGVLETWNSAPGTTPISQIVLAAPDIDAGRFRQIGRIFNKYDQVTLYASRKDRAIMLSRKLKTLARAGDASPPIVMQDLSTIDVTSAGAEIFGLGHSYFATSSKVFRDLYYIIQERLTPDRRAGVKINELGHYELS